MTGLHEHVILHSTQKGYLSTLDCVFIGNNGISSVARQYFGKWFECGSKNQSTTSNSLCVRVHGTPRLFLSYPCNIFFLCFDNVIDLQLK